MKIIFICGSAEPGSDGVGDYIRRLCGEVLKNGHEVAIIALNDKFTQTIFFEFQKTGSAQINVLRCSANLDLKNRLREVKLYINSFNPDWISLQFVPFAYQDKGLPFKIIRSLSKINFSGKWHIMFHELWVGMEQKDSTIQKAWGLLQKYAIRILLKVLQPKCIHTQAKLYEQCLKQIGYYPIYLPLFGNIEFNNNQIPEKNNDAFMNEFRLIIFGGIHYGAPVKYFLSEIVNFCNEQQMKPIITFIGKCGDAQTEWVDVCNHIGISYQVLGEQSTERISNELSLSSIGIATTPLALIDKSGAVAAMLEHGLHVISVSRQWNPKRNALLEMNEGISIYKIGQHFSLPNFSIKKGGYNSLEKVSHQFIEDLNKSF